MVIRVGTSGWSYEHWNDVLYYPATAPRDRLQRYSAQFDTVELNASFYHWPRPTAFAGWRQRLPEGFRMSAKAPRGLTHGKRLYAPESWIQRIAAGWHELGERRALLLVQLEATQHRDDARLEYFLRLLPDWIEVVVELRHPSWDSDGVYDLLERHGAAYCVTSGAGLRCVLRATSHAVYVRMHGPDDQSLYAGSYSEQDLAWWADRIQEWSSAGHDVYVYFNNDGFGHAVRNARSLRRAVGQ